MKRFAILLLLIPCTAVAAENYGSVECKLVSVYDGDTFKVDIPGWPDIVGRRVSVRVNGIDTPERRDKRPAVKALAQQAKERAVGILRNAKVIELRNMQRGKYFRIVADVYADDINLGRVLLVEGLAKPYDGRQKPKWGAE